MLVTGTIQAVSKFAAAGAREGARASSRPASACTCGSASSIALGFVAAAPLVSWLFARQSKTAPLMLAGLIVGGYAFYAVFIGTANGLHQFHKQAGLDITFATLRGAGLLGMAMAGLGVIGVIGGWVAAVGVILIAATVGRAARQDRRAGAELPVSPLIGFFVGVALYLALFNALMFVDTS